MSSWWSVALYNESGQAVGRTPVDGPRFDLGTPSQQREAEAAIMLRQLKAIEGTWADEETSPTVGGVILAALSEGYARWVGVPAGYVWRDRLELTEEALQLLARVGAP